MTRSSPARTPTASRPAQDKPPAAPPAADAGASGDLRADRARRAAAARALRASATAHANGEPASTSTPTPASAEGGRAGRDAAGTHRRTLGGTSHVRGPGLFTGQRVALRLSPAAIGDGLYFVDDALATADVGNEHDPRPLRRLPASLASLEAQPRHTVLGDDHLRVETVEHLLAALAGCGITDAEIGLSPEDPDAAARGEGRTSYEVPMGDGSASAFLAAIGEAGVVADDGGASTEPLVVREPVHVSGEGGASLAAVPGREDALELFYTFDAPAPLGRLTVSATLEWSRPGRPDGGGGGFAGTLGPARTFIFEREVEALRARGWGGHLTAGDLLVIGPDGPVDNAFRFDDEPARHKALDLVGDLALLGRPVAGRIYAHRSGHALNHELARSLARLAEPSAARLSPPRDSEPRRYRAMLHERGEPPAMDARAIQRILPHRYPMLLVDRVLAFEEDRKAIGLKNVSMGDLFFQGHYPKRPIFPGVLIVEAMGQLGGILLSRKLEHTGKIAILLSMNRVKMRHQVVPGDQLLLVAEAVRVKSRTGQVRCRSFVGDRLAAEAEIKFMLADAEEE